MYSKPISQTKKINLKMKKLLQLTLVLFSFVLLSNISRAGSDSVYVTSTYQLVVGNMTYVNANTFEFDIYMKHTNRNATVCLYGANQYFFQFNTNVANGGILTYSIVSSELAPNLRPVNPTVTGNQLRLAANLPTGPTNTDTVKWVTPGTKVAKMRLANTVAFNQADTINLRWKNAPGNPFTKVTLFGGNNNVVLIEVTNAANHFVTPVIGINPEPVSSLLPTQFSLSQNYPNPFNPSTKIEYALPVDGKVNIVIYDIIGREVMSLVNEVKTAGYYTVNFNGTNLASGMYFYRLDVVADNDKKYQFTKRMVLVK